MGQGETKIKIEDYNILQKELYTVDTKQKYEFKKKEYTQEEIKKENGFKNIFVSVYDAFKIVYNQNDQINKKNIELENIKIKLTEKEIEFISKLNQQEETIRYGQEIEKEVKKQLKDLESTLEEKEKENHKLKQENETKLQAKEIEIKELKENLESRLIEKEVEFNDKIKQIEEKISKDKEEELNLKLQQHEKDFESEVEAKSQLILSNDKNKYCFENNESYDMVIGVTSLMDLRESVGWKITTRNLNSDKFNYQKDECIVVGVIGNFNRGKSFILQKLSGLEISQGFSVNTEGLSVKFPKSKEKPVTILDTAGFETPIKLVIDENEIGEVLKDRVHTEIFLQKFIINHSNVLVVVVGILTLSDQKLINRLKKFASEKKLIIVHNLLTFTEIDEVEKYIKNTLILSFNLSPHSIMSENDNDTCKGLYWQEKICKENKESKDVKEDKEEIVHFILAKEKTNAGNKYNDIAISSIKYNIITFYKRKVFDPIEAMKNHILYISKEIFESAIQEVFKNSENKQNQVISSDDTKIYLKGIETISLTNCFINEQGLSSYRSSELSPDYAIYKTINNKLEISIEIPDLDLKSLKISPIETRSTLYELLIKGKKIDKKDEQKEHMIDNIKKGDFSLFVKITKECLNFAKLTPCDVKYPNGILIVYYDLIPEENDKEEFDPLKFFQVS